MSVRIVEWAVSSDDGAGEVGVSVVGDAADPRVRVEWYCGEARDFSLDGLAQVIDDVERLRKHKVWMVARDSSGQRFAVRVDEDGSLLADNTPSVGADDAPWEDLKRTLKKAASEARAGMPAETEEGGVMT